MKEDQTHKLIIIGSGPAGYTAAIYAARAQLNPILFEGFYAGIAGGQLMTTTDVENYPGFPEGVSGPAMMEKFRQQAQRFGCKILTEDVQSVDLNKAPFSVKASSGLYHSAAIILATGATAKKLDVRGTREGELWQKGVSACAVCDGAMPIFREKELFVIGGGDSAAEEALFLTKYASHVFVVHRRGNLRASKIMADRLLSHPKITVLFNSTLDEVQGTNLVENVILENVLTKEKVQMSAGGVFFAIGHRPNTAFLGGQVDLDDEGYILTKPGTSFTSIPGVFAAGDVQDRRYRQAVTAAGSGCMAALDAERWISEQEGA